MPDPATLAAGCILASLVLYALFGGADFGGGFWDLLARGPRATDRRRLIAKAIGPVWETNHIWIILAIVVLFTAFPGAFAVVCTALFVPVTIVLAGIVLRGAAFAFHAYRLHEERGAGRWGAVFASASLVTPVFLGVVFGAISSGRIRATDPLAFTGDVRLWLSPFPIAVGFLALSSFAFLAAVYLLLETNDSGMREEFRRDSFRSAAALVFLSGGTLAVAAFEAQEFFRALTGSPWSIPIVAAEVAAAAGAIVSLAQGVDKRQGGFALGEVIPDIFPQVVVVPPIVQGVVHQLECRAEMHPIGRHVLLDLLVLPADHGRELRRRLEQLGGLVADDFDITFFGGFRVMAIE